MRNAAIASLLFLVITFSIIFISLADLDHLLIIHFDSFGGIDFLGYRVDMYNILWFGLLVNLVNWFLVAAFYKQERFLSYLLGYFNVFFSLLILIAIAVIISIN